MNINRSIHFWLYLLIAATSGSIGCKDNYAQAPDPVLGFHADRTEIVRGEKVTVELRYRSSAADDCFLTDSPVDDYGYFDEVRPLGTPIRTGEIDGKPVWTIGIRGAPDQTTELRAVCWTMYHESRHLIVITVLPADPVLIAFLATPDSISPGDPVNLIWAVDNVDDCTIEPLGEDVEPGAHSVIVYPEVSTVFTLICSSGTRIASRFATITVNP